MCNCTAFCVRLSFYVNTQEPDIHIHVWICKLMHVFSDLTTIHPCPACPEQFPVEININTTAKLFNVYKCTLYHLRNQGLHSFLNFMLSELWLDHTSMYGKIQGNQMKWNIGLLVYCCTKSYSPIHSDQMFVLSYLASINAMWWNNDYDAIHVYNIECKYY